MGLSDYSSRKLKLSYQSHCQIMKAVAEKALQPLLVTDSFILEESEALPSNLIAHHFNHFTVKYSQALISFSAKCDRKLMHLQIRINRIENALGLLEKKLEPFGSGKEVEIVTSPAQEIVENPSEHVQNDVVDNKDENISLQNIEIEENENEKDPGVNEALKVKDAPELQPFFKMLRMGVPLEAVKLK